MIYVEQPTEEIKIGIKNGKVISVDWSSLVNEKFELPDNHIDVVTAYLMNAMSMVNGNGPITSKPNA